METETNLALDHNLYEGHRKRLAAQRLMYGLKPVRLVIEIESERIPFPEYEPKQPEIAS